MQPNEPGLSGSVPRSDLGDALNLIAAAADKLRGVDMVGCQALARTLDEVAEAVHHQAASAARRRERASQALAERWKRSASERGR